MQLLFPKEQNLIETGPEDPLKYYYLPLLGWFYQKRLRMVLYLVGNEKRENVLDIGYGSGILFPELNQRFKRLHGCDIHPKAALVRERFKAENINLNLVRGDILSLPYKDNTFDTIICISILEHISNLDKANLEIRRILKKNGNVVLGFPSSSRLMQLLFKLLSIPFSHHISDEKSILNSIKKSFDIKDFIKFPKFAPFNLVLYFCCKGEKDN